MQEIWVDIKNTKGNYRISNFGRIFSIRSGIYLKTCIGSTGYAVVGINILGSKRQVKMHRIMAEHFLPNPNNLKIVHHINHDRTDFRIENLMWVTAAQNKKLDYSDGVQIGKTNMKGLFGALNPGHLKVRQLNKDGNLIRIIDGISEAARIVKGSPSHITKVCKGKLNTYKGFKWEYHVL